MSEAYALMSKIYRVPLRGAAEVSTHDVFSSDAVRQSLIDECVCDALLCTVILDNLDDPAWLSALADILETERAGSEACSVRT